MSNKASNPILAAAAMAGGVAALSLLLALVGVLGLSCKFLVWAWTW